MGALFYWHHGQSVIGIYFLPPFAPREVSKFLKVTVSESEHKLGNLSHTKRGSGILSQKVYVGCGL